MVLSMKEECQSRSIGLEGLEGPSPPKMGPFAKFRTTKDSLTDQRKVCQSM